MNTFDQRLTPRLAVALKYDGVSAPKVTAKGEGDLAEQILAIAAEHGVHLHEDKALVRILSGLDLGDEIPEALYWVIAEIIAMAYIAAGKRPHGFQTPDSGGTGVPPV